MAQSYRFWVLNCVELNEKTINFKPPFSASVSKEMYRFVCYCCKENTIKNKTNLEVYEYTWKWFATQNTRVILKNYGNYRYSVINCFETSFTLLFPWFCFTWSVIPLFFSFRSSAESTIIKATASISENVLDYGLYFS